MKKHPAAARHAHARSGALAIFYLRYVLVSIYIMNNSVYSKGAGVRQWPAVVLDDASRYHESRRGTIRRTHNVGDSVWNLGGFSCVQRTECRSGIHVPPPFAGARPVAHN